MSLENQLGDVKIPKDANVLVKLDVRETIGDGSGDYKSLNQIRADVQRQILPYLSD